MTEEILNKQNECITADEIKFLVEMGATAPTGDNRQPFTFLFEKNKLSIFHNQGRSRHAFNNQQHSSIMSLGCVLKAIDMAASASSLAVSKKVFLDPLRNDKWCELEFNRCKRKAHPNVDFIPLRMTDRRPFCTTPVDQAIKDKLNNIAASHPEIQYSLIEKFPENLMNYLLKSESYMWKTPQGFIDVFEWIRFSKKEIRETEDGMPVFGLGINAVDAIFMKLLKRFPFLVKLLWPFALQGKVNPNVA